MKTLGFDLAWSGTTGWATFDDKTENFSDWGDFTPARVSAPQGPKKTRQMAKNLGRCIDEVLRYVNGQIDLVAFEAKDWNDPKQIKSQKRLYQAELVLIQMTDIYDIIEIGANEAKAEFGAKDKREAAQLLAYQWPGQFTFQKHKTGWLTDLYGHELSADISDAMVIAYVASRKATLRRLIEKGEG